MKPILVGCFIFGVVLSIVMLTMATSAAETLNKPWDWTGIVGTGQSLAVGAEGNPPMTTSQMFNNLKISLEDEPIPPLNPKNNVFKMIPLVEPIRKYGYYTPGPYPGNIFGETPHTSMANQISALVKDVFGVDYITAHTVVGESGQGIDCLRKDAVDNGNSGRAFAATLFEVEAIKFLAEKENKLYGVGGIIVTHGEKDSGNINYENELYQLWYDYNKDIKNITGQSNSIPMFVTQQNSCGSSGTSDSTIAQWMVGVNHPGDIICAGPNYYLEYAPDGVHLTARGYQQLGEKYGKIFYEKVVLGKDWQPLQPKELFVSGNKITIEFNVPVSPLKWDTKMPEPNQEVLTEWKNGKGFEVISSNYQPITINSVEISGDSVVITCAKDVENIDAKVGYAYTADGWKRDSGTYRWGLLKDSDMFIGYNSGIGQENYCVSFVLPIENTKEPIITTNTIVINTINPTEQVTEEPTNELTEEPANEVTPILTNSEKVVNISSTQNDWGSGATIIVKIKNETKSEIDGWSLSWEFNGNQIISNLWSGVYKQTNKFVKVSNVQWNKNILPNNTIEFGFNISYSGVNKLPTEFVFNGNKIKKKLENS